MNQPNGPDDNFLAVGGPLALSAALAGSPTVGNELASGGGWIDSSGEDLRRMLRFRETSEPVA